MKLYYSFDYDIDTKIFFGVVLGTGGHVRYEIDDAADMAEMIENGLMKDIDDVRGLETYLKQEGILNREDYLILENPPEDG